MTATPDTSQAAPAVLLVRHDGWAEIVLNRPQRRNAIDGVLADAGPAPGHIFNLGHGIWPETDPDAVARLVDYVHEKTSHG